MKKISVLVLVMLLIVQMTAFASPAASTITIDVVQTGENIDVTAIVAGAQEVPERMTIQIFPTVNTEVSTGSSQVTFTVNTMVYMEETSNVATVENGYKYAVTTIHPDNIFSIRNVLKDDFKKVGSKEFKRGPREIYFKSF